jgi:hypothetical protein
MIFEAIDILSLNHRKFGLYYPYKLVSAGGGCENGGSGPH